MHNILNNLKIEFDVLKKISEVKALICSNKYLIYKVIVELANKYPILALYLGVSTLTFYFYEKYNPQKYDSHIMSLVVIFIQRGIHQVIK